MAYLYANENFPRLVVLHLRGLGHDVLTTLDAGMANRGIENDAVLMHATLLGRCVLTINRKDFIRLHRASSQHGGIIVCTENRDYLDFAAKIHLEIQRAGDLTQQLVRVTKGTG